MSRIWWDSARTTQGHGIFSQYNPEHQKEWIRKEARRQEKQASPERVPVEPLTFHRDSLLYETEGKHLENLHNANVKHLDEIKLYQTAPNPIMTTPMSSQLVRGPPRTQSEINRLASSPVKGEQPPHFSHRHYYGWSGPTPTALIGGVEPNPALRKKYGDALQYCQNIQCKSSKITTRKA